MRVFLSHHPNPDIPGGYWSKPRISRAERSIHVETFGEASAKVRQYIDENDFGMGNCCFFRVTDDQVQVTLARVSYNGRVWDTNGKEIL